MRFCDERLPCYADYLDMNTKTNQWRSVCLTLAMIPLMAGCSVLGFSPYPVAHVMTKDTKAVLGQTPSASDVPRELAKEVQPAHFLQPGDELLVETLGDVTDIRLPADQQIMADGSIDLGIYGRLVVASMTLEQAEDVVQRIIAEQSKVSIRVNVRLIQPIARYYVVGEVNSPGAYPLTGHETVLDAIMEAGGLTSRASACDLLLARPTSPCSCRVTLPVCYRAITQLGDTTTNYHLQPGDRIFASRQSLHEELFAFVHGGKTCDRCCKQQRACCDPRSATIQTPEFVHSGVEAIAATDPPAITEVDGAAGEQGIPKSSEFGSDRAEPSESINQPLDGELDFGGLLSDAIEF